MTAAGPETCISAIVGHTGALLMVRRGRGPSAGLWSVPGGRVKVGETLAAAVEREVAEETSVDVECGDLVGVAERLEPEGHYIILSFAARCRSTERPSPIAGDDADDARWVRRSEVDKLDLVDGLLDFLYENGVLTEET